MSNNLKQQLLDPSYVASRTAQMSPVCALYNLPPVVEYTMSQATGTRAGWGMRVEAYESTVVSSHYYGARWVSMHAVTGALSLTNLESIGLPHIPQSLEHLSQGTFQHVAAIPGIGHASIDRCSSVFVRKAHDRDGLHIAFILHPSSKGICICQLCLDKATYLQN